jgi:hypothetical protein
MIIDVITETQLLEGFIATIFLPLFLIFFKYYEGYKFIAVSALSFFFTWIARKISINNFMKYRKMNNIPIHMYGIQI